MTRKEQIEERIKQLKAQLAVENSKETKKERAQRARELIQIGAMLMSDKDQAALVAKYRAEIAAREVKKAPKTSKKVSTKT